MAVVELAGSAPKARKDANFESKSARKRRRKGLIRGHVANAVNEAKLNRQAKIEFYRKVRLMKERRRRIAHELALVATLVGGMEREVVQVGDRIKGVDGSYLGEAFGKTKDARASVSAFAEDWHSFSRARIFYYKNGKAVPA